MVKVPYSRAVLFFNPPVALTAKLVLNTSCPCCIDHFQGVVVVVKVFCPLPILQGLWGYL
jgi:hypothetical protein